MWPHGRHVGAGEQPVVPGCLRAGRNWRFLVWKIPKCARPRAVQERRGGAKYPAAGDRGRRRRGFGGFEVALEAATTHQFGVGVMGPSRVWKHAAAVVRGAWGIGQESSSGGGICAVELGHRGGGSSGGGNLRCGAGAASLVEGGARI